MKLLSMAAFCIPCISVFLPQYNALFSLFFWLFSPPTLLAHTQMGRLDEARTIFSQGIEAAGMAGEALHSLLCSRADVLHRLKRLEECIEDCTRAIRCQCARLWIFQLLASHSIGRIGCNDRVRLK